MMNCLFTSFFICATPNLDFKVDLPDVPDACLNPDATLPSNITAFIGDDL